MYSLDYSETSGKTSRIHLIDTPGFDDSNRLDVEVLQEIVFWLTHAYDNAFFLDGLLYLHNINAPRFEGAHRRGFDIFKALCGEQNYKCVYLASTFWDEAKSRGDSDFAKAFKRHDQLQDEFWEPLISGGAQMRPAPENDDHDEASYAWADQMLEYFVRKSTKHVLQIQSEMQAPSAKLDATTAGQKAGDLWRLDALRKSQIPRLNKTKEQLVKQWWDHVTDDLSRFDKEISDLTGKLQRNDRPPSYHEATDQGYRQELKQKRDDIERQKMLKLTSYGMWVNSAAATFGGISAAVALSPLLVSCTIM
jgi:hypothetical protein